MVCTAYRHGVSLEASRWHIVSELWLDEGSLWCRTHEGACRTWFGVVSSCVSGMPPQQCHLYADPDSATQQLT